jgi:hypothetical protein
VFFLPLPRPSITSFYLYLTNSIIYPLFSYGRPLGLSFGSRESNKRNENSHTQKTDYLTLQVPRVGRARHHYSKNLCGSDWFRIAFGREDSLTSADRSLSSNAPLDGYGSVCPSVDTDADRALDSFFCSHCSEQSSGLIALRHVSLLGRQVWLVGSRVVGCWAESLTNQQRIAGNPDRRTEIRDPAKRAPLTKENGQPNQKGEKGEEKQKKTNQEKRKKTSGKINKGTS